MEQYDDDKGTKVGLNNYNIIMTMFRMIVAVLFMLVSIMVSFVFFMYNDNNIIMRQNQDVQILLSNIVYQAVLVFNFLDFSSSSNEEEIIMKTSSVGAGTVERNNNIINTANVDGVADVNVIIVVFVMYLIVLSWNWRGIVNCYMCCSYRIRHHRQNQYHAYDKETEERRRKVQGNRMNSTTNQYHNQQQQQQQPSISNINENDMMIILQKEQNDNNKYYFNHQISSISSSSTNSTNINSTCTPTNDSLYYYNNNNSISMKRKRSTAPKAKIFISRKQMFVPLEDIANLTLHDMTTIIQYAVGTTQEQKQKHQSNNNVDGCCSNNRIRNSIINAIDIAVSISSGAGAAEAAAASSPIGTGHNDIDVLYFIAVIRIYAEWRHIRMVPKNGYRQYSILYAEFLRRDLIHNLYKIETVVHQWMSTTRRSTTSTNNTTPTMQQLFQYELPLHIQKLPKLVEKSFASGILWTKRQLHYHCLCLEYSMNMTSSSKFAIQRAYNEVYSPYHGWTLHQMFHQSQKVSPNFVHDILYRHMNNTPLLLQQQQQQQQILSTTSSNESIKMKKLLARNDSTASSTSTSSEATYDCVTTSSTSSCCDDADTTSTISNVSSSYNNHNASTTMVQQERQEQPVEDKLVREHVVVKEWMEKIKTIWKYYDCSNSAISPTMTCGVNNNATRRDDSHYDDYYYDDENDDINVDGKNNTTYTCNDSDNDDDSATKIDLIHNDIIQHINVIKPILTSINNLIDEYNMNDPTKV